MCIRDSDGPAAGDDARHAPCGVVHKPEQQGGVHRHIVHALPGLFQKLSLIHIFQGEWQIGYKDTRGYEAEGRLGRYIGEKQWIYPYIGVDWTLSLIHI